MLSNLILMKSRYLLLFTILLFTACAPQAIATSNPTAAPVATAASATEPVPDKPITLHLAVSDAQGRPSEPFAQEFVDQVNTLSKGNITIEPIWDAGADITPSFEQGVVKVVKDGQYELGLASSRAWDYMGVTSFEALQAPFLITDDALAEAVASSEIGTRMLDGLPSVGITGLGIWPEDLRHPFAVIPGKTILSPEDFKGLDVRSIPSEISYMLIQTLGGSPTFGDEYQAAESGLLQGPSLTGTPTATGNVIFFPKFQVLFANGAAFEQLSEGQRSILREAATAAQRKAIADHPSEADAAAAWCADGGSVVMASAEQVAAFEAAAKPVFDKIEKDPLNAELIAAIRELKTKTTPAPGAEACKSELSQSTAVPTAENEIWSTGLPPNGQWTVNLTAEDLIAKGIQRSKTAEWSGQYSYEFQDGKGKVQMVHLDGVIDHCDFTYTVLKDYFHIVYFNDGKPNYSCGDELDDVQWRLEEDGLHLHLLRLTNASFFENKAVYEAKPWQKTEE